MNTHKKAARFAGPCLLIGNNADSDRISWAALRTGRLPRALNYLGVVIGVVGILTVVPALKVLQDVFGLTQIVWFVWVGIVMLRDSQNATA